MELVKQYLGNYRKNARMLDELIVMEVDGPAGPGDSDSEDVTMGDESSGVPMIDPALE